MARRKPKPKRPLKEGTRTPAGGTLKPHQAMYGVQRLPGTRRRGLPALARHRVRRVSILLAVLAPLTLIGLAILATNPDYTAPAMIVGVLALIAALGTLMTVRASGWWLWPGVFLGIALLVLPGQVFKAEVILHRGVRAEVQITAAHSSKTKNGGLSWSCDVRRVDGRPLPHARLTAPDCWGRSQVGTTEDLLVDPGEWVPPVSAGWDYSGLNVGVGLVGGAAVLWALLALAAGRRTPLVASSN